MTAQAPTHSIRPAQGSLSETKLPTEPIVFSIIGDEKAVALKDMPPTWQAMARGDSAYGQPLLSTYVDMAQIWFAQMMAFGKTKEAWETLEFYGKDFARDAYPHFETVAEQHKDLADSHLIVDIAKACFQEFGYHFPASFYFMLLAPLRRESITQKVALRFSEQEAGNARAWDACLHAMKSFNILKKVESIHTQFGLTLEHKCGCNHLTNWLSPSQGVYHYGFSNEEDKLSSIKAFVINMFHEYAIFHETPVLRYLVI